VDSVPFVKECLIDGQHWFSTVGSKYLRPSSISTREAGCWKGCKFLRISHLRTEEIQITWLVSQDRSPLGLSSRWHGYFTKGFYREINNISWLYHASWKIGRCRRGYFSNQYVVALRWVSGANYSNLAYSGMQSTMKKHLMSFKVSKFGSANAPRATTTVALVLDLHYRLCWYQSQTIAFD
jgi:hypothetical protein